MISVTPSRRSELVMTEKAGDLDGIWTKYKFEGCLRNQRYAVAYTGLSHVFYRVVLDNCAVFQN